MRDLVLTFRGQDYRVPANRTLQLCERVEDIVRLDEIAVHRSRPKYGKMARAYGEILRFAGCRITDEEIHDDLMRDLMTAHSRAPDAAAVDHVILSALDNLFAVLTRGAGDLLDADPEKKT
jgi:hypothetical protein